MKSTIQTALLLLVLVLAACGTNTAATADAGAVSDTAAGTDATGDVAADSAVDTGATGGTDGTVTPGDTSSLDVAVDAADSGTTTAAICPYDAAGCMDKWYKNQSTPGQPNSLCKTDADCTFSKKCVNVFGELRCAVMACAGGPAAACPGGMGPGDLDPQGCLLCTVMHGCETWQSEKNPKPGEPLSACKADGDCTSGKCVALAGKQVCTGQCMTGNGGTESPTYCCPVGLKCTDSGSGKHLCLPPK